jgi:mono/diheme cytochrome c family protein
MFSSHLRVIPLSFLCSVLLFAQEKAKQLKLDSGKEIFEAACVGCHGPDGKGQPQTILGFEPPDTFPDFSDCPSSTPELDIQWRAIVRNGGKTRGFTEIMPSFRDALTDKQIEMVVAHLRTLCTDKKWPRAEFNLPRPLYTEKAYPENETVVTNGVGKGYFNNSTIYEKRFGARTNMEFVLPFSAVRQADGRSWFGGIGDVGVEIKQTVWVNNKTGSMITGAGEFTFATGNKARGYGNGVFIAEPFLSYAQLLPKRSFFQLQTGMEFPTHTDDLPREHFVRMAVGKSISGEQGWGRTWSPMMEFLMAREHLPGATVEWDVAPQMQMTLSKRQHIRASGGVRVPVVNTVGRSWEIGFYMLWDWFDGGLRDGWK